MDDIQDYQPRSPSTGSPGLAVACPSRFRLPTPVMPFFGREEELVLLDDLLIDARVRLITILGPGGMGKSRLALEAARRHTEHFTDGIFWITLGSDTTAESLIEAVAEATGFVPQADRRSPHAQLLDYLSAHRAVLFVLDNGEYLGSAVLVLNEILEAAPCVCLLVTSRQRLNQSTETVLPISGLDYPSGKQNVSEAVQSSTVQLFVEAARRVQPDFDLTEDVIETIIEICGLVDGMPLALVLAASWLMVLSPAEIARAIERDLDILETDLSDVPPRQRSIRAVFESSWQMLSAEQHTALMKLSVFHDGFTSQAAQAIAGAGPNVLRTLAARSLIERRPLDGRLEIHDLLRQYAREYLEESGDAAATEAAHGHFFLAELARLEPDLKGRAQREALDAIEADFGNVLAAWKWALGHREFDLLGNAIEGAFWYGMMRNRYQVMEPLFERTIDACTGHTHSTAQRLRLRLWWMRRWREGSFVRRPEILQALEATLAELGNMNQPLETGVCLLLLGDAAHSLNSDPARASGYLQQSLTVFQEQGARFYQAWSLHFMAKHASAIQGVGSSIGLQRRALEMRRELGDLIGVTYSQYNLSTDLLLLGDLVECERIGAEMLDLSQLLRENSGILMARTTLSLVAFLEGRFEDARMLSAANLALAAELHHLLGRTYALVIQGLLAAYDSDQERAAALLSEGERFATQEIVHHLATWGLALIDQEDDTLLRGRLVNALKYAVATDARGAMVMCLIPCALREAQWGSAERAAGLLALHHTAARSTWFRDWPALQTLSVRLEAMLGASRFTQATDDGAGWDLKATIQTLLREYSADEIVRAQFSPQALAANHQLIEPLSNRELEVLQAVALGYTNQEIAAQLVVELSTVKKHVTHIYDKLAVTSRAQAILAAQELGLAP